MFGIPDRHIDEELLELYILKHLADRPELERDIEEHLLFCRKCQDAYEDELCKVEAIKEAVKNQDDPPIG